jgi:hypothetical protein
MQMQPAHCVRWDQFCVAPTNVAMTAATPRDGASCVHVWLTIPVVDSTRDTIEWPGGPLALFWWM